MNDVSTVEKAKKPLKGLKWRIGVMLVWLTLFVMGFNDFYVRESAVDGLWFIGVILFIILFRRYHRGQVHMSDPYSRSDHTPSFLHRYPYRLTGSNHGGEFPPTARDSLSTSSSSFTPITYSHDSSSSSIRWESSHDRYRSSSSSSYDTSHLFRNNF